MYNKRYTLHVICYMSNDVQQIKNKLDVVDLLSEYIKLKPAGINHKGLCPFHNEKTPSFMVSRERQNWHCFGCSKGGDIFTFVQDMEGMDFREALKYLADKAGIQLTHNFKDEAHSSQKNRIKDINRAAALFFHNFLIKMDTSKPAVDYLYERGLIDETIEEWHIGFVSDQWDLLTKYLLKKGHSIDDLVASGLTIKRDNANTQSMKGFYDRFRGRIMFPIWDIHDHVVGFTGRVLVETEKSGGKYVNTPQTPVYDKSRVVFGLNKAKRNIKQMDKIVMCEGQMDVIACHQAGMNNVVASSGTALTEEQVKLLKRYSNNMNMAFDADEAGEKAAKRGRNSAVGAGMNVKIIQIPDGAGKDPDEVLQNNKQVWFDAVENAVENMQWEFAKAFRNKDLSNSKDKQAVASILLPEIKRIPFAVERDHWIQELSARLKVDAIILREDMKRVKSDVGRGKKEEENKDTAVIDVEKKMRLDILLEQWFVVILKFYKELSTFTFPFSTTFSTGVYAELYEAIKKEYNESNKIDIDKIREYFAQHSTEQDLNRLLMTGERDFANLKPGEAQTEIEKLNKLIKDEWLKSDRKRLQAEIALAEKDGDEEKLSKLMQEFQQLK